MAEYRRTRFLGHGFVSRWSLVAALVVSPLLILPLAAQQSAGVRSLLDDGLRKYDEGDYESARNAFERAFAMDPSDSAVLDFVERATVARVLSMMRAGDPGLAGIARQLLDGAGREGRAKVDDIDRARAAVDDVLSSSGQERLVLRLKYTNEFGRNLVPLLIPLLGDPDIERRAVAIGWVPGVGLDAVPALIAGTRHSNPTTRLNIARLLSVAPLRHPVSLAALKDLADNDADALVREAAQESVSTLMDDLGSRVSDRQAKEYYVANAYQYYMNPHKNPFARGSRNPRIYRVENDAIVGEVVAPFQLSERMAAQSLDRALNVDPNFAAAWILQACNDAAQIADYDHNVRHYANLEGEPEIRTLLESQKVDVDYVLRLRLLATPASVLYQALSRALDDKRSEVAHRLIETIGAADRGGDVPQALVSALHNTESRIVRVAAATVIARWKTSESLESGSEVVRTLSSAVLSSGVRTVQRIMGDVRKANRFASVLHELNMETYTPITSVERGLEAVFNMPPDAILMDENVAVSSGRPEVGAVNYFVSVLRRNYLTANVPVAVVVSPERVSNAKDLYESEERKVWVISENADSNLLRSAVFDPAFAGRDDSKAQATGLAVGAAHALEWLASIPTKLPVQESVPALIAVLDNRPDAVRLPCIRALGKLQAGEAAGELAKVYEQDRNSKATRVAAMTALGQVLAASSSSNQSVLDSVKGAAAEADLDLRRAGWSAAAGAPLSGPERLKLERGSSPKMVAASEDTDAEEEDMDEDTEGDSEESAASEDDLDLDF